MLPSRLAPGIGPGCRCYICPRTKLRCWANPCIAPTKISLQWRLLKSSTLRTLRCPSLSHGSHLSLPVRRLAVSVRRRRLLLRRSCGAQWQPSSRHRHRERVPSLPPARLSTPRQFAGAVVPPSGFGAAGFAISTLVAALSTSSRPCRRRQSAIAAFVLAGSTCHSSLSAVPGSPDPWADAVFVQQLAGTRSCRHASK